MKYILLVLFIGILGSQAKEEDLKCNFRICGAELLSFEGFSITGLFRKAELASFCIRNCTPPVVHEFFQSIIFAVTRRIPGHCNGEECTEKNRFIALAKCVHEKAWPLLQCSKRLVDLAQVAFDVVDLRQKRNYTCSIVVETTQCIEEILQECGAHPFSLAKEIFGDVIKIGIRAYCPQSPRKDFFLDHTSSTLAPYQDRMKYFTDISPSPGNRPYPQFVKGYKSNSATLGQTGSLLCFLSGLWFSGIYVNRFR